MHLATQEDIRPIESVEQLREYFAAGCKPREKWRVGTEFELLGVRLGAGELGGAPGYEGRAGIRALLEYWADEHGWSATTERDYVIAVSKGGNQITYEPGGQLELAARPVYQASELRREVDSFIEQLVEPSRRLELAWLGLGFRPFGTLDDVPWMPKERYEVMRARMPKVGALGLDMMKRAGTVQVNMDFSDPEDARAKLRAIMSTTSLMTALFANSAIVNGADSGFQSYRTHVWTDTDPDRCGLLELAFADRDVFETYSDWALDVPMYFVHRGGYVPAGGMTFRRFMRDGFQGERATMDDWALHLSTLFPEARMKRYIEVRGCDSGSRAMILALGPLVQGFLYDPDALRAATALTASLDMAERRALTRAVAREGLRARTGNHSVLDLARELVAIASAGLERQSPDDLPYLEPLRAIAATGRSQSDDVRDLWRATGGDANALIEHAAMWPPRS